MTVINPFSDLDYTKNNILKNPVIKRMGTHEVSKSRHSKEDCLQKWEETFASYTTNRVSRVYG